jgi:phage gp29-like protein
LKPVFDLIEGAAEFSEVETKLAALFPKMKTDQIQLLLQKCFFLSETIARVNQEENI